MADLKIAIALTLVHEGGYVNNPADPGGATNMGITQADMPGQNMKELTQDQAVAYYSEHFWKPLYSQIQNQPVANKLFDLGVLFGVGTAVGILQTVLQLTVDHSFGPDTLSHVNQADPISLLQIYKTALVTHALAVAAANPAERIFVAGWIRRINS